MNLLQKPAGRIILFSALYASEGGPIGFIWWAVPTLLRAQGVELEKITGLTATLVLFWAFKFLWAPLVDSLRTPRWGLREWILSMQLLMGIALLPLLWIEPARDFEIFAGLLALHALAATTQDVAVDALAVHSVPSSQRGTINGCMQAGMLAGRSLFGGGALLVAGTLGWQWLILSLVFAIWISTVLLIFTRDEPDERTTGRRSDRPARVRFSEFRHSLGLAFRGRKTWAALAFALLSGAAFEATGALAGPFLIDRGATQETVGFFFGVPVVLATMAGGIAGGKISDRISRARSIGVFLAGFVLPVIVLGITEAFHPLPATPGLVVLLTGMYLFVGLFTAASYALFMDLTDRRLGGTQFSTYMAATNGCESWSAWAGGRLASGYGYPPCFLALSLVSLLSLPILALLGRTTPRRPQNRAPGA